MHTSGSLPAGEAGKGVRAMQAGTQVSYAEEATTADFTTLVSRCPRPQMVFHSALPGSTCE